MNNRRILNLSTISIYIIALMSFAAAFELALFNVPAPAGMAGISEGLAGTGFQVTVIAVSILTVIINISGHRAFGIKMGEYLQFRKKILVPGFYDLLIIIVLLGALQYAALAFDARFAAAFIFVEIITLLIIELRWGLGIAFFYHGKEKEMRAYLMEEIMENLEIAAEEKTREKRRERASLAVSARIDNLFSHTQNAVSLNNTSQAAQNISLMANILDLLLDNKYHSVWHNYETRVDKLFSTILSDDELSEPVVSSLVKMTDVIMATKESEDKQIAMNCDFDRTRSESYWMLSNSPTNLLQNMFEKQIFYKLALVKIYGIKSPERKTARYAFYTNLFAENLADSAAKKEIMPMITASLKKLIPKSFEDGNATETAVYFCLLLKALEKHNLKTDGLWYESEDKQANDTQKRSLCMLKRAAGIDDQTCELSEQEINTVKDLKRLLETCE